MFLKSFLGLIVSIFLFFQVYPAMAQVPVFNSSDIKIETYRLVPNDDSSDYELEQECTDTSYKRYKEVKICETECDECVLDNELCWSCKNQSKNKESISLWAHFKNWVGAVKDFFIKIIKQVTGTKDLDIETPKDNIEQSIQSVSNYHNDQDKKIESEIEQELKEKISSAPDFGRLLKLRSLFMIHCSDKYPDNLKEEQECQAIFMKVLKKRGDQLKEKLFSDIDVDNPSGETYQKIVALRALLMAGRNTRDEGVWFSTDNINKVMNGLKVKMKKWFQNALLQEKFSELDQWYALAKAYMLPQEDGSEIGGGLFEGGNPILYVQYRARRLALQEMIKINICNPDPAKLKQFQARLANPGCEKLLGNRQACRYINNGNLEAAYASLYDKDRGDESNKVPANKVPEPIDCSKKTTSIETDTSKRLIEDKATEDQKTESLGKTEKTVEESTTSAHSSDFETGSNSNFNPQEMLPEPENPPLPEPENPPLPEPENPPLPEPENPPLPEPENLFNFFPNVVLLHH